tara:strand:+ start:1906 stop:2481 length:576 start_codon:yes stop_codon:yes gene_type:complete
MKELNQKLAKIQTRFKSKKSRFNSFGKYYFRSAEDILEATKPFLTELGVSVTVNETLIESNPPIIQTIATISDGENKITATALVGVDLEQKGMQMPQKYGAASSYGKKYALGNLFLIDDTQDADSTNGTAGVVDKIKQQAKPVITTRQLAQAKDYVVAGGSLDAIKLKYKLTAEQEKALTNEQRASTKTTS